MQQNRVFLFYFFFFFFLSPFPPASRGKTAVYNLALGFGFPTHTQLKMKDFDGSTGSCKCMSISDYPMHWSKYLRLVLKWFCLMLPVWEVHFHPSDPDHLFTCSEDGSLWHWDTSTSVSEKPSFLHQGKNVWSPSALNLSVGNIITVSVLTWPN